MKKTPQKHKDVFRIDQYQSSFLKRAEITAREGKTVYIHPEFHEKLSLIVFMLGERKITIADYMHSVLEHHFRDFGAEISALYTSKQIPNL